MSARGRKPTPCPDRDALRRAYEADSRPTVIAQTIGANIKQVRRWLAESGIMLPPSRKHRPAGVTPRFVSVAWSPTRGRRVCPALHNAWSNMKRRTRTDHPAYYRWYKAKGIKFCSEWNEYANFRTWALANGYRKGLWLDRIDGERDYEPANCRWTTRDEQMVNMSSVHKVTLNGVTKPLPVWTRELGLPIDVIRGRLNNGWSDEHALTLPIGSIRPGKLRGRAATKARRLAQALDN